MELAIAILELAAALLGLAGAVVGLVASTRETPRQKKRRRR